PVKRLLATAAAAAAVAGRALRQREGDHHDRLTGQRDGEAAAVAAYVVAERVLAFREGGEAARRGAGRRPVRVVLPVDAAVQQQSLRDRIPGGASRRAATSEVAGHDEELVGGGLERERPRRVEREVVGEGLLARLREGGEPEARGDRAAGGLRLFRRPRGRKPADDDRERGLALGRRRAVPAGGGQRSRRARAGEREQKRERRGDVRVTSRAQVEQGRTLLVVGDSCPVPTAAGLRSPSQAEALPSSDGSCG